MAVSLLGRNWNEDGFIGTGKYGWSHPRGYAKSSAAAGNTILIHNRTTERNEEMAKAIRNAVQSEPTTEICNDNFVLSQRSDIVIVGVKPMDVPGVLEEIKGCGKLIISMAAGVSLASMEAILVLDVRLIRIMPNTPAQVGEAMTAMTRNGNVSAEDFDKAKNDFDVLWAEPRRLKKNSWIALSELKQPGIHIYVY